MHKPDKAPEPSMEEILASIRKIIAEEPVGSGPEHTREPAEDEPSSALPTPRSDDDSTDRPPYSVDDALADLMDDGPLRPTAQPGEPRAEREPAPKPQGQPASPEGAGHRPSWLFGRASGPAPAQQHGGAPPDAPRGPAGSLRGQLETLRSGPERASGDDGAPERKPDTARSPDDARSLSDRPHAAGSPGLASFPTPPAGQSQQLPRPSPQRAPTWGAGPAGAPGEQSGAAAGASKPAAAPAIPEAPPASSRASPPAPQPGLRAEAARSDPSAGPAAAPPAPQRPADQSQDTKAQEDKPAPPPVASGIQQGEAEPRSKAPQTDARSGPQLTQSHQPHAASRSGEQPAAARTLEDTVAELLRPMLREWLDTNMPRIVEKALRVELAATAKQQGADGSR